MKKVKFKFEYVPLSDAQIERHKNFDALITAFALQPKPTFMDRVKAKLFENKLMIYAGGIITGAVVTSLMWWGATQFQSKPLTEQQPILNEKKALPPAAGEHGSVAISSDKMTTKEGQPETTLPHMQQGAASESEKRDDVAAAGLLPGATQSGTSQKSQSRHVLKSENAALTSGSSNSEEPKQDAEVATPPHGSTVAGNNSSVKDDADAIMGSFSIESADEEAEGQSEREKSGRQTDALSPDLANEAGKDFVADTLTVQPEKSDSSIKEPQPSLAQDTTKRKLSFSLPKIDLNSEWGSTKRAVSKITDTVGSKTSDFIAGIFKKDTIGKEERTASMQMDSPAVNGTAAGEDTFIHRFAQVSFVTPLSTDGLDSKRYMHNLSFNILQGYTGALRGFELGGLANVKSGYVKGMQIGGLVNFAFGDVSGMQLGGLVNNGMNVDGFQLGGITNIANGNMRGMQLGGIANIVADTLTGFQLSGVLNLSSEQARSKSWQLTGVSNVSLGEMYGGQIAGVVNLSAKQHGIQVGLINYSKKITGFQLGLINVADTIQGESLGLINISKNGLHKAEVFGSEALYFSGGLKLGSPHVYTLFAAGVAPTTDLTRIGLGLGVGGQFGIDKAFVSVDGVCWTIHNDNLNDWEAVNLLNQLRVTGGYRIAKGVAVYAGPTYNVHVYDNRYPSVAPYTIFQGNSADNSTYTDMWIGGVIGFQFF